MEQSALLRLTPKGLYCPIGDFFIDPIRKVDRAIITHGHSDHARPGHKAYLTHTLNEPILRHRLGKKITVQSIEYGRSIAVNGVNVSFYPAGHIIGSSQILLEYKGATWCVSGDYKIEHDGISQGFQPVKCQNFITECTFGLPVYQWRRQEAVIYEIQNWWQENAKMEKCSILSCYSLGKAQRLAFALGQDPDRPLFAHKSIYDMHNVLRDQGVSLPAIKLLDSIENKADFRNALILAPGGLSNSPFLQKIGAYNTAFASGWMRIRKLRKQRSAQKGFVLSDHADWNGLLEAVKLTGARRIFATHGYNTVFSKYLNEIGYEAYELDHLKDKTLNE